MYGCIGHSDKVIENNWIYIKIILTDFRVPLYHYFELVFWSSSVNPGNEKYNLHQNNLHYKVHLTTFFGRISTLILFSYRLPSKVSDRKHGSWIPPISRSSYKTSRYCSPREILGKLTSCMTSYSWCN